MHIFSHQVETVVRASPVMNLSEVSLPVHLLLKLHWHLISECSNTSVNMYLRVLNVGVDVAHCITNSDHCLFCLHMYVWSYTVM